VATRAKKEKHTMRTSEGDALGRQRAAGGRLAGAWKSPAITIRIGGRSPAFGSRLEDIEQVSVTTFEIFEHVAQL